MAIAWKLTRPIVLRVAGACTCCGDFNLFWDGKMVRWESEDKELAEKYQRGGTEIIVPAGALLKDLEMSEERYLELSKQVTRLE